MANHVTKENIFEDLGFNKMESENLRIRSALMRELVRHIREQKLTQKEAAVIFDVTQLRVSDLMRGKINKFTIDMLVNMLSKAGIRVAVVIDNRIAA